MFKSGKRKELDCLFYKAVWKVVGKAEVPLLGLENSPKLLLVLWKRRTAISEILRYACAAGIKTVVS